MLPKIRKIRGWIDERDLTVDLEVDGGVTTETIVAAASAGANIFVAGTAVYGAPDYAEAIAALRQKAAR